jgi:hypothetical protein
MIAVVTFCRGPLPDLGTVEKFFQALIDYKAAVSFYKTRDDAEDFIQGQFDDGDWQAYFIVDGGKVFRVREELTMKEIK